MGRGRDLETAGSENSCWFSVCSHFFLEVSNDDFQTPYMPGWKLMMFFKNQKLFWRSSIYWFFLTKKKKKTSVIKKQAEDLNRHFCQENTMLANSHTKRSSMPLIIRYMQIKTAVRYHHLTPEKLLSKTQQITSVGKDIEKREPSHTSYTK